MHTSPVFLPKLQKNLQFWISELWILKMILRHRIQLLEGYGAIVQRALSSTAAAAAAATTHKTAAAVAAATTASATHQAQ